MNQKLQLRDVIYQKTANDLSILLSLLAVFCNCCWFFNNERCIIGCVYDDRDGSFYNHQYSSLIGFVFVMMILPVIMLVVDVIFIWPGTAWSLREPTSCAKDSILNPILLLIKKIVLSLLWQTFWLIIFVSKWQRIDWCRELIA